MSGFQSVNNTPFAGGLLLMSNPRGFFAGGPPEASAAWRHLLLVSLAAAVLGGFSIKFSAAMIGASVLFVNAVGMTCIFTGFVFMCLWIIAGGKPSLGRIFSICAFASLGPILISWIPGSVWVAEPWKWWVAAVGLSETVPCGMKKAMGTIACAVGLMYGFFWIVLSGM